MYDSTERINKIYKLTSEYGNIQTQKTNTYKTLVKKVLNFIELDVTQFAKTTQLLLAKKKKKKAIAHGPGTSTIFMNKV